MAILLLQMDPALHSAATWPDPAKLLSKRSTRSRVYHAVGKQGWLARRTEHTHTHTHAHITCVYIYIVSAKACWWRTLCNLLCMLVCAAGRLLRMVHACTADMYIYIYIYTYLYTHTSHIYIYIYTSIFSCWFSAGQRWSARATFNHAALQAES